MAVNRIWLLNAPANGVSAADRAQILIGYSGIALGEAVVEPPVVTPPAVTGGGASVRYYYDRQKKKFKKQQQEDEDIMAVIMAFLHTRGGR